ncbi:ISL3 family transposase [Streptomyces sp. NBC_00154]|uniref:ISL3 family transposase n=1 Tax=Streptomyces sp. NBC_00154 TaxID=2975670 RepID=UPI0022510D6F|nr:ISL3 family transposase [Streptomyces sp. NBC_00154]MCX5314007.1 ISL3 family transposase [Streptomyces sp. NBC_00154]MCX5314112.1 ISL3 family transposase [Streptomyces sp. NBC_00154]MCX5314628.1 ISL3 family transposase [Streptomyces sp. NBC_00154]MCX5314740.1 ISL3 family transposase [Streptomyces sp. NBC_00154]MCX5315144.1 ISL3 family transposase [Streptomyces sp. NBC_00154]
MRSASIWTRLLGVEHTVVASVEAEEGNGAEAGPWDVVIVAHARPAKRRRQRCGVCGRRCARFDNGEGRRRWRALDLGVVRAFIEADAPRVSCPEHGVVVAHVPWARHGAGHTLAFDDTVAWLATHCSKTTVVQLLRIGWRTVGGICARVWSDVEQRVDLLAGLTRIGIDEISYKRHHKYLTVVVDHDSGRLVWAAAGRDKETLRSFFDLLGPERSAKITHVSADAADWIAKVVAERCPQAVRVMDPFHVVQWATDALDTVRREVWNAERGGKGRATPGSKSLKKARWALWKRPEDLTEHQRAQLEFIAKAHPVLHRAYLLKEGLRLALKSGPDTPEALLDWVSWARRSRLEPFVKLQRAIVKHWDAITAAAEHSMSNGIVESMNTKIRLITRMAFGFKDPAALIALTMLSLGGHRPHLPGRQAA